MNAAEPSEQAGAITPVLREAIVEEARRHPVKRVLRMARRWGVDPAEAERVLLEALKRGDI